MGNGGGGGGNVIGTGTARRILGQRNGGGLTTRLNRERNVNAPRRARRAAAQARNR